MRRSLFKSTATVSCMTFISRILGFVRDIVCAHVFGAAAGFDAFIVAFKIPNFMRRLFAEGAFMQAFVPVLSEYRETQSRSEALRFIHHMAGTLIAALILTLLLFELLAPFIIMVFAPGFIDEPVRFGLASHMFHITAPYILLIALTAFAGSMLNTYGVFSVPAFTPVLLNLSMIFAALYLAPHFSQPVIALAWGVFIGGVVQLIFQIPFLWRKGLMPKPKLVWRDPGVQRVLKLMIPALFGVSVAQISILVDTLFASFLPIGSISWLYYADRLSNFPLGVFGVALATVVLPHLSRKHADHNSMEYSQGMDWALRLIMLISIPAAIGLIVLAGPLLSTLFQYGKFNLFDVVMTRKSLIAFAVGLPAFMLIKVLASGFYAKQNIRTPVKIAAIAVVTNIILNAALIMPLKHAGLALATSLSSMLNASFLWYKLIQLNIYVPKFNWLKYILRIIVAAAVMGCVLWWGVGSVDQWAVMRWTGRVLHILLWVGVGVVIYFASLLIIGIRFSDFRSPSS